MTRSRKVGKNKDKRKQKEGNSKILRTAMKGSKRRIEAGKWESDERGEERREETVAENKAVNDEPLPSASLPLRPNSFRVPPEHEHPTCHVT